MTVENLKKLLQSYDFEDSGDLNKTEWIKLCSHSTIDLSSELSLTLFNELDRDKDGLVKISDILQELRIWEASNQQLENVGHEKSITDFREEGISEDGFNATIRTSDNQQQTTVVSTSQSRQKTVILERRKQRCSLVPSELNIPSDGNDQWLPKTEINPDGSEVFTTTPIMRTPRYSSVCELENVITQNYPELMSPFKIVLQDFRKELLHIKREKSRLEETYMKEKAARKSDLDRLEGELESQIKSIEERAKYEVHEKLQNEYKTLVCNKEQEITEIREQVENLRRKISHGASTRCDSMNSPITLKKFTEIVDTSNCYFNETQSPTITSNYSWEKEEAEQKSYKKELENVLTTLIQREAELKALKDQLAKQEAQLTIDKRELISQEEEKQNLYSQLNVMRTTMERLNQTNDYLCTALHQGSLLRQSRNSPSSIFSEFLEQSGFLIDNNESFPTGSRISPVITFPLEQYEFDSLEDVLPAQQQQQHQQHQHQHQQQNHPRHDSTCRRSDYSSENVSSISAFNYDKNEFPTPESNNIENVEDGNEVDEQQKQLSLSLTPTRIFKVIMVGDSGVGKSSFSYRFCDGVFYPHLRATLGVDFRTKNIRMNNSVYTIQLWDTAGQETYRCIIRSYFRKIDGVILMYAVDQPETFANVKYWMETIRECVSDVQVPILLVGNKIDLRNTKSKDDVQQENNNKPRNYISYETGKHLASLHQVLFIETSVLSKHNVTEAIELLTQEMKLIEDKQVAGVTIIPSMKDFNSGVRKNKTNKQLSCCI
uniref:EF-hand domain-containing protein n=2 Tax=Trichobilharzia regenti TaxID=157069 RepID=A0AA85KFR0_TRIRE|nr:unnamed protein product [Trichobilharzia regenti]